MESGTLQIHYFSGTGNAENVAHIVRDEALSIGSKVEVINLKQTDRIHMKAPEKDSKLIFVSPVHGFNYPPVMLHYISRFPKGGNQVMLMNTRAGMRIGKWVTPGISGISLYLAALVLMLKGYRIQALCPVDLPSNWISLHPALNKRTVDYIYSCIVPKIRGLAQSFFAGKRNFKCVRECLIDAVLAPIAVLYYAIGRFAISKTFYASKDCTQCGLCEKECPVQAIKTVHGRPFWTFKCESCMKCMSNCSKRAIETAHGFIVVVAIGFSALMSSIVYRYLNLSFIANNEMIKIIFDSLVFVLILGLSYRMFHFLLRFRWFERMAVYTSLTKYKFWGRYKAPKSK